LSEIFSFCPKNNGFGRVRGLQPLQPPGSYAYVPAVAEPDSETAYCTALEILGVEEVSGLRVDVGGYN